MSISEIHKNMEFKRLLPEECDNPQIIQMIADWFTVGDPIAESLSLPPEYHMALSKDVIAPYIKEGISFCAYVDNEPVSIIVCRDYLGEDDPAERLEAIFEKWPESASLKHLMETLYSPVMAEFEQWFGQGPKILHALAAVTKPDCRNQSYATALSIYLGQWFLESEFTHCLAEYVSNYSLRLALSTSKKFGTEADLVSQVEYDSFEFEGSFPFMDASDPHKGISLVLGKSL